MKSLKKKEKKSNMYEKKIVILFDIDYTLFNTKDYKEKLFPSLGREIGYEDNEESIRLGQEAINYTREKLGYFDTKTFLERFLSFAKKETAISQLEKIVWRDDIYTAVIYDDVISLLEVLIKTQDITIGILSTGERKLQVHKIKQLLTYFEKEHIHIFANKVDNLTDVLKKYAENRLYLVDDTIAVLAAAKKVNKNVTTILIDNNAPRKPIKGDILYSPDETIHRLHDILNIIKKD